ncbi:MAG: glycosyltransferase family A protein [Acidimicrobiales bacterium]
MIDGATSPHTRTGGPTTVLPATVAVYVCTHQRNRELGTLLDSLAVAAERVATTTSVGVIVIDDNPDGRARAVVEASERTFPLGLGYRHSGSQNISVARNLGLEATMDLADWVAMTDDDCVVHPDWLEQLVACQMRHDADAVTGPLLPTYPNGAPGWLTDEPFEVDNVLVESDEDRPTDRCATNNSMVRTRLLRDHPEIRFDPALGTLGGEDMVFFGALHAAGMRAFFTPKAKIDDPVAPDRLTLRYQLRKSLWLGNSMAVTTLRNGEAGRGRVLLRGLKRTADALAHPVRQLADGGAPQLRFTASRVMLGAGLAAGAFGVAIRHH